MKECACGCRNLIEGFDSRGREVRFLFGHGNRGRKFPDLKHEGQFSSGHTPFNKGEKGYQNAGTFKVGHEGLRQEKNPNWRGGFVMRNGYRNIRVNNRTMYLHRYIMEQHLGRKLLRSEHVHHINHDKTDNSISNLQIMNQSEHLRYHANVMWGNIHKMEGVL